jgi:SAM-dependent methyltransferase
MSFPWHHRPWREAAEFIGPRARTGDRILAPDQFWRVVSRVERYVPSNLVPEAAGTFDWVVLDLDDMPQIPRAFLESVAARMMPAFANAHFVIWTARGADEPDTELRDRLVEFWVRLAALGAEPSEPNRYALDAALLDAPELARFADLSDAELRTAMNEMFERTSGYRFPTRRDQGYLEDLDGHHVDFLERVGRGRVLEVCAGGMRFSEFPDGMHVVRSDFSEVGLRMAQCNDGPRPGMTYAVTDAQHLGFATSSFDAVVFRDAIEHVRDPASVLTEVARVLVAGGWLFVSYQNSNSLHLLLTEKLGYPKFHTSNQHFREFTLADVCGLLRATGFEVRETAGITLYPYWGVPGIDSADTRALTDDDPELVEVMRELGRRAGAEYAHTGVVVAQRA